MTSNPGETLSSPSRFYSRCIASWQLVALSGLVAASVACESSQDRSTPSNKTLDLGIPGNPLSPEEDAGSSAGTAGGSGEAIDDMVRLIHDAPPDAVGDAAAPASGRPTLFVRTDGTQFVEGSRRHVFVGINFWTCMNMGAANAPGDRGRLLRELDALRALGITNLRIMASAEGPDGEPFRILPALMTAPGVYNEDVFAGLDFCLDELSKRGMRAVMVLNNFWQWSGGMAQYVSWQDGTRIPYPGGGGTFGQFSRYAARFYGCANCQQQYRNHIQKVTERVNTINGLTYRDDPAIFSWELANEPRAYPDGWTNEIGGFIKSLDSNHMVTVGSEGNWSEDFLETHQGANIDYGTVHIWAENIGIYDPDDPTEESLGEALTFATETLVENEQLATQLDKPLVLEEFGLARDGWTATNKYDPAATVTHRDAYFQQVFGWVEANMAAGGALAGDGLWAWGGEARPPSAWAGDPPHEPSGWYSVYNDDASTLGIIQTHAAGVK